MQVVSLLFYCISGSNVSHYRYIQYLTRKYTEYPCTVEEVDFFVIIFSYFLKYMFARTNSKGIVTQNASEVKQVALHENRTVLNVLFISIILNVTF